MKIILGIDPGTNITGYGCILHNKYKISYISSGCITSPIMKGPNRLKYIFNNIFKIIKRFKPNEIALEKVFFSRNVNTILKLEQVRSIVILAASQANINLFEYTASQVKKQVVGKGNANKTYIIYMIRTLLNLSKPLNNDAADALAIALTHIQKTNKKYFF